MTLDALRPQDTPRRRRYAMLPLMPPPMRDALLRALLRSDERCLMSARYDDMSCLFASLLLRHYAAYYVAYVTPLLFIMRPMICHDIVARCALFFDAMLRARYAFVVEL